MPEDDMIGNWKKKWSNRYYSMPKSKQSIVMILLVCLIFLLGIWAGYQMGETICNNHYVKFLDEMDKKNIFKIGGEQWDYSIKTLPDLSVQN